jgi:hypothetical protein
MPHLPGPGNENRGSSERMERIRVGMMVVDAAGQILGKVVDVYFGDSEARQTEGEGLDCEARFARAERSTRERNTVADLAGRQVSSGYIKIGHEQRLHWSLYFYAMEDEIASIDGDTVRLRAFARDLMSSLE